MTTNQNLWCLLVDFWDQNIQKSVYLDVLLENSSVWTLWNKAGLKHSPTNLNLNNLTTDFSHPVRTWCQMFCLIVVSLCIFFSHFHVFILLCLLFLTTCCWSQLTPAITYSSVHCWNFQFQMYSVFKSEKQFLTDPHLLEIFRGFYEPKNQNIVSTHNLVLSSNMLLLTH